MLKALPRRRRAREPAHEIWKDERAIGTQQVKTCLVIYRGIIRIDIASRPGRAFLVVMAITSALGFLASPLEELAAPEPPSVNNWKGTLWLM
jgi:hypothetical protein